MSLIEDLNSKTVFELKSYAKKNGIDIYGVSKKVDILEIIFNFVPKETNELVVEKSKPAEKVKKETVALFAVRNIHRGGFGSLTRGYNIVTKEASEKWIGHEAVRIASPQEVATHYGK